MTKFVMGKIVINEKGTGGLYQTSEKRTLTNHAGSERVNRY